MSSSRSADGRFPVYKLVDKHGENWDTEILENLWNKLLVEHNLPFRRFHVGAKSSAGKRARWMDIYLRKNAYLFDHHGKKIDVESVYEDWLWFLSRACRRLGEIGLDQATERLQRPINARLTIWRLIDPPDALLHLCGRGEGWIDQDLDRRRNKAAILKKWQLQMKEHVERAVYLSGSDEHSNDKLQAAIAVINLSVEQGLEQLSWEAN